MAFRNSNRLQCYVCDAIVRPGQLARIDGDDNLIKREIAIMRRDANNRVPLDIADLTRLCVNCNRSLAIERDPTCLRLNVLTQTSSHTCMICNQYANIQRLSVEPYVIRGHQLHIILQELRRVRDLSGRNNCLYNDESSFTDEEFKSIAPISKDQFHELYTFCDPVPRGGHRHVSKRDLLLFLCKLRQGLSNEFFKVIFHYPRRQIVSLTIQSYCRHKGRHLVKPALIVAPDGYILTIQGPYFSDSKNNDAQMLRNEYARDGDARRAWFQDGDILVVDRGYRDVKPILEALRIHVKMPSILEPGQRQFFTEQANESRLVTKTRWIIEARKGI
ncbi:hypothetical protein X777_07635 [Ooceraea biroi]|uniref:DDE Tnp4 domain-containing protein n=1 Tax=Ooceraea biroi TaxID=2015173 RepID=A0A026WAE7_OOCBI|nr:hypothetical protein X777_07635 [Ooceraea biroi]